MPSVVFPTRRFGYNSTTAERCFLSISIFETVLSANFSKIVLSGMNVPNISEKVLFAIISPKFYQSLKIIR